MSLSWRDVACGLPVPLLPMPLEDWGTRFFLAVLTVTDGNMAQLHSVSRRLLEERVVVRLPDGAGPDWPCRLTAPPDVVAAADGQWGVQLEFEVVEALPAGPES